MERLTSADALFLELEDQVSAMHSVTVASFEGPEPPFADIAARVGERIATVPRLRQRVVEVPLGLARPVWIDDDQFSIDYHVRHTGLPGGATMADVRNLIGRLQSQRLDRGKPLWELWQVSGLPDGHWALVSKVHYALVDGVSGADPLSLLVDQAKGAAGSDRQGERWAPAPPPGDADLVRRAVGELVLDPAAQFRLARRTVLGPLAQIGALPRRRRRTGDGAGLVGAVSPHRRWQETVVRADAVRALRDDLDVTTNDVILGLITWGIRAMILAGDREPPEQLRCLAPLAIATGDHFTNEISALEADLPIGLDTLEAMILAVNAQTAPAAGRHKAVAGAMLADLRGLMAPTLCALGLRSATRTGARMADIQTVAVNAPGPRETLTVLDRPMVLLLPAIPLVARVRVAVGVMSYRDRFGFGVTGDRDAGLEVAAVAEGIAAAVADR